MKSITPVYVLWITGFLVGGLLIVGSPDLVRSEKGGGTLVFEDTGSLPPVVFRHDFHLKVGNQCGDCHDGIFKREKGSADVGNALTMEALRSGKFCGTCHNGKQAFSTTGSCGKCHVKGERRRLRERRGN